jgi:sugar phosphate isomerase/epimerase
MKLGIILSIVPDPESAIRRVHDLGFPTCQVLVGETDPPTARRLRAALERYGIEATSAVVSGPGPEIYDFYQGPLTIGLSPRQYRPERIVRFREVSDFATLAGIPAVQGHCGFIPENPHDPIYAETVDALRTVAQYCRVCSQKVLLETGQETPITLVRTIRDVGLDNVGVNFDGANLVLYGKANPLDAFDLLAPHILGVHAKDGLYPTDPEKLGEETPIGQGKVDFPALVSRLKKIGYQGALTIEREIEGEQQTADILAAKAYLEQLL